MLKLKLIHVSKSGPPLPGRYLVMKYVMALVLVRSLDSLVSSSAESVSISLRHHGHCAPWWRHQMEPFSALQAICAGNSSVPGEFPAQRSVTRSFDVFFDLRSNKRLSKQCRGWWLQTQSCPLWGHRNAASNRWHRRIHTVVPDNVQRLRYFRWHQGFCSWNCTPLYRGTLCMASTVLISPIVHSSHW